MDDLKCKKAKVANKKHDSLIKLQKKVRKKRKRNYKTLKEDPKSMGLLTEIFKPTIQKTLGRSRKKGRERVEGMFFKGLRSEYIKRETLNEVNEARKNEDLNKIIDIGRVFLQKSELLEKSSNRNAGYANSGKLEKSPVLFRRAIKKTVDDFNQCPLSPISFEPSWKDSSLEEDFSLRPMKITKFDYEKEFYEFSRKYEEAVGTQVLLRLPEDGVLEDALKALRKLRMARENEPEMGTSGNHSEKESQFEFENLKPAADDFLGNIFSHDKISFSGIEESFVEKPLESEMIQTDFNVENYYSLFTPEIDNDDEGKISTFFGSEDRKLEKPTKSLNITTPMMQFYRRNMF